jgi:hypothetical protein
MSLPASRQASAVSSGRLTVSAAWQGFAPYSSRRHPARSPSHGRAQSCSLFVATAPLIVHPSGKFILSLSKGEPCICLRDARASASVGRSVKAGAFLGSPTEIFFQQTVKARRISKILQSGRRHAKGRFCYPDQY